MAVFQSKKFYLLLNKNKGKSLLSVLGNNPQQHFQLVFHYCNSKKNEAIKSYLEKAAKYDKFFTEQVKEYELGKKFLANMMGKKSQNFTQEQVDEAIEYLFPSRLFVPRARPMMKHPSVIFGNQKEAAFDLNGRPFNFLFYTTRPNYTHCLHEAALLLEKLNSMKINPNNPPKPLSLIGVQWLTHDEIRKKFMENIYSIEYEKLIEVLTAIVKHPFSSEAKDFLKNYQKSLPKILESEFPTTITSKDDVKVVTIEGVRRKTSTAKVSVSHPGSGQIRINNMHLDYFNSMLCRHQVSAKECIVFTVKKPKIYLVATFCRTAPQKPEENSSRTVIKVLHEKNR